MEIGNSQPASQKISEANDIVSFAKAVTREVDSFVFDEHVNFVGCSYPYVKEKLSSAIYSLEWLRSYLKTEDELQQKMRKRMVNNGVPRV